MATQTITYAICDRCGSTREGKVGIDLNGGYVSFGPVNGANDEHVGVRAGGRVTANTQHADICEDCRESLLKWWRLPNLD